VGQCGDFIGFHTRRALRHHHPFLVQDGAEQMGIGFLWVVSAAQGFAVDTQALASRPTMREQRTNPHLLGLAVGGITRLPKS
jgi:hypothetical protein